MKKHKACGPDRLPIEVAKALGDEGAMWMTGVLNEAMREGISEEWRTSTILRIHRYLSRRLHRHDRVIQLNACLFSAATCTSQCKLRSLRANPL